MKLFCFVLLIMCYWSHVSDCVLERVQNNYLYNTGYIEVREE